MSFTIDTGYSILCYIATLCLFCLGISIYVKNEDVCELSFKKFNEDKFSRYPSTTLCFSNSIDERILETYQDEEINVMAYSQYLRGYHWNEKLENLSYDRVSLDLQDYVVKVIANYNQDPDEFNEVQLTNFTQNTLATFYDIYKCITFDMLTEVQDKLIYAIIALKYDEKLFPNGI